MNSLLQLQIVQLTKFLWPSCFSVKPSGPGVCRGQLWVATSILDPRATLLRRKLKQSQQCFAVFRAVDSADFLDACFNPPFPPSKLCLTSQTFDSFITFLASDTYMKFQGSGSSVLPVICWPLPKHTDPVTITLGNPPFSSRKLPAESSGFS